MNDIILELVDILIQITRVGIISAGAYFLVDQIYCYVAVNETSDRKSVRRIFIGYDVTVLAMMIYAFFVRQFKIDTFSLLPSVVWLVIHMAFLAVIIYSYRQVEKINKGDI